MIAMWVRHLLQWSGSRTRRTRQGEVIPEQHLRLPVSGGGCLTGYDRLFSAEREGGANSDGSKGALGPCPAKIHDVYIGQQK